MRCLACDCNLSDVESTRKSPLTGEYYDLCTHCLNDISLVFPDEEECEEEERRCFLDTLHVLIVVAQMP